MGDLNSVLERIVALRTSIVDDGIANGVPFHPNDLHTLVERLRSEGTSFVKVTLPLLGKALDKALVSGAFSSIPSFRLQRESRLPRFCNHVFNMILNPDGTLRLRPHLGSIYFLRQFLLLDSKLITEPTVLQENVAFNEFVTRQVLLRQRPVPIGHPVVERASHLLTEVLKDLDLSSIPPGHGPGGVAEKLDRAERWGFSTWPKRAERIYPYSVYGSPSFVGTCEMGPPRMVDKSITRCCLVPKDFKGPRLISAESAATQYLQQGQMKLLMEHIDNHWLLSRSIKLRDQTHNQRMCVESYENGTCTLDLSNASDNVSAVLVWHLLRGVPRLRRQLFSTRSQLIELGKERIVLASFSPMGSAVCFPIETLVFWALTLASVRFVQSQWGYQPLPSLKETASCIAVFGDDIIVPEYALQTLRGTLIDVGCEVNESKTCSLTPFRESCGIETFSGADISIIRNKRYHYDAARNIANYPELLDLQRKFFLHGLVRSAALLCQWVREIGPIVTVDIKRISSEVLALVHSDTIFWCLTRTKPQDSRRSTLSDLGSDRQSHGGIATAFPSGLDIVNRSRYAFDRYCAAIGWDSSLDSGVRIRFRTDLQRHECRLPTVFQLCRQWPTSSNLGKRNEEIPSVGSGRRDASHKEIALLRLNTGYPRLLARLTGDYVERIAIRNHRFKMAWSEIPFVPAFTGP